MNTPRPADVSRSEGNTLLQLKLLMAAELLDM